MRAAQRAVVLVLAVVFSVIAVPAYAGDDSPGLLETLGTTVDTVTAPIAKPRPAAPAAPKVDPVGQLTTIVDSTLGTSLGTHPLVTEVETVVAAPAPAATVELPEDVVAAPVRELAAPATALKRSIAAQPVVRSLAEVRFSASARPGSVTLAKADEGQTPRTSTLPDGGSPLTSTWLVLALGVTSAGVVVIRRARCGTFAANGA